MDSILKTVDVLQDGRHEFVTVEPDGGPIFVELTGPPGTREFILALFDA